MLFPSLCCQAKDHPPVTRAIQEKEKDKVIEARENALAPDMLELASAMLTLEVGLRIDYESQESFEQEYVILSKRKLGSETMESALSDSLEPPVERASAMWWEASVIHDPPSTTLASVFVSSHASALDASLEIEPLHFPHTGRVVNPRSGQANSESGAMVTLLGLTLGFFCTAIIACLSRIRPKLNTFAT